MSITLYGIKNCDTIKKARKWLTDQGVEFQFHDYRTDGIDRALLESFLTQHGWQVLLNKRGTTWRQQSDDVKDNIDETSAIDLMLEHPAMIKRPVICTPDNSLVGFKADQYQTLFAR